MTNYLKIKESVEKNYSLNLSSSFTKFVAILSAVLLSLLAIFALYKMLSDPYNIDASSFFFFLLIGVITALSIYQVLHIADAKLKGKYLILKTIPGKEYQIHINQIQSISGFALKSTRYMVIKFPDADNNIQTILILNAHSIFNSEKLNAKDIIEMAQKN